MSIPRKHSRNKLIILFTLFNLFLVANNPPISYAGYSCESIWLSCSALANKQWAECDIAFPFNDACDTMSDRLFEICLTENPLCSESKYSSCNDKFNAYIAQCNYLADKGDKDCWSSTYGHSPTTLLDWASYLCSTIGWLGGGVGFELASDIMTILSAQGKSNQQVNSYESCISSNRDITNACKLASFNNRAQCTLNRDAAQIEVVNIILLQ